MSAAWEWRSFRPGTAGGSLLELGAEAAERLHMPPPGEIIPETDTYLVIPGLRHNLKLRRGSLEIKRLLTRLRSGYSLWEDKAVYSFPLGCETTQQLWSLLPGARREPPDNISSSDSLVAALRHQYESLSVVQMYKHRIRLDTGRARLEIADLELPGVNRWLSFCSDGYALDGVRQIVQQTRLRNGSKVMSYVDFLQEAVWWFRGAAREVVGTDGR